MITPVKTTAIDEFTIINTTITIRERERE